MIFILNADKNKLTVCQREPVTSGSVNACEIRFEFSPDWSGLTRTAVFKAGRKSRAVLLDGSGTCSIPWEVLEKPNIPLLGGVYGARDGEMVLPTVWASLGTIQEGVTLGAAGSRTPQPELWEQALGHKGDKLGYTEDGEIGLFAGDKLLSSIPVSSGEDEIPDHRRLSGRDAEEQHPISSISGLAEQLKRIPEPVEPLTNEELEELLK